MSEVKFKVGDVVKVTNKGAIYKSFRKIGDRYPSWECDARPRRLTKYEVIGVHLETSAAGDRKNIYAVQNASGQVYLYGGDGLELDSEYEEVDTCNPDWLLVFHTGDTSPDEGVWAGLTIFDNETEWYCFRNKEGELRFLSHSPATKEPLDAVRAAAMLLVFADEEAKL